MWHGILYHVSKWYNLGLILYQPFCGKTQAHIIAATTFWGRRRLAKAASTVSTTRLEAAAYLDVVCVHYSIYTVLYSSSICTRHVCLPTALKATNDGHEDYVDDVDFDDDDFTVVAARPPSATTPTRTSAARPFLLLTWKEKPHCGSIEKYFAKKE